MIDKAKLGFWELFTYFLIGLLITIFFIIYTTRVDLIALDEILRILKDCGALGVVLFPIIFLILGLLFEPIGNFSFKYLERISYFKPRESRGVAALEPVIIKYLPAGLGNRQAFRYCKAVVEQNFPNSNISVFLARFGFYRGLGILMIMLCVVDLILIDWDLYSALQSFIYLSLSIVFIKRAQSFKGHMEYETYYNFIAYKENVKFKGIYFQSTP